MPNCKALEFKNTGIKTRWEASGHGNEKEFLHQTSDSQEIKSKETNEISSH